MSDAPVRVVDAPAMSRYEAHDGEVIVGVATYDRAGDVVTLTHTTVFPHAEGRGVGGALARGALDDLRARGLRVAPRCPFMAAWIRRHPEYADLVVPEGLSPG